MFVNSEGHPGARLQRALAVGNLTAAEQAAFEVAFVPLAEARSLRPARSLRFMRRRVT